MGNAFQEQFLKLGLVDEKKLKQAKQSKHKQTQQVRKGKQQADDSHKRAAQQAQAAKAARDRELNEQRQADAARKAAMAEVKQLIADHGQAKDGDVPYNFVHNERIRRIYINEALRAQIGDGSMGIVKAQGSYHVVPAAIVEKIRARAEHCVVLLGPAEASSEATDPDDPYAAYQVPDDLIW